MNEQWKELKETIIELRDSNGTGTQQEVCKFLANYMDILEKQMQEPCEDAISRQAVLNKIKEVCFSREQEWVDFRVSQGSNGQRDLIINFIEDLSPVNPTKTGHWIKVTNGRGGHECDLCYEYAPSYQSGDEYLSKYCPSCGERMIEPQERRDKEW